MLRSTSNCGEFAVFCTLAEIDPESHDVLVTFKVWAEENFGTVREAFKQLAGADAQVTYSEFRKAAKEYEIDLDEAQQKTLFRALDMDDEKSIGLEEVKFLENWDMESEPEEEAAEGAAGAGDGRSDAVEEAAEEAARLRLLRFLFCVLGCGLDRGAGWGESEAVAI